MCGLVAIRRIHPISELFGADIGSELFIIKPNAEVGKLKNDPNQRFGQIETTQSSFSFPPDSLVEKASM